MSLETTKNWKRWLPMALTWPCRRRTTGGREVQAQRSSMIPPRIWARNQSAEYFLIYSFLGRMYWLPAINFQGLCKRAKKPCLHQLDAGNSWNPSLVRVTVGAHVNSGPSLRRSSGTNQLRNGISLRASATFFVSYPLLMSRVRPISCHCFCILTLDNHVMTKPSGLASVTP